ncbi:uncharacterized protein PHACADRAFT_26487 [Phanerochaete carnosa HHB-10118-sp]|uniref:Uncharacterized protein n=1 Tax=Phanerochaete carnosa (strain HHB-10118-sp) TaxID=650164 RepID=K5X508_PHACS|nr:uncharacterized protein PHACADRAFT_26487 [Phanerochaete carnosa HHB-10118-sp]EKM57922.1 hypothetical protein PHACADRAFT_26487 [Phanerochaete carnosa HHB-10118-sp]
MPLFLMHDEEITPYIQQQGKDLLTQLDLAHTQRTLELNPQTLWAFLKKEVVSKIRKQARTAISKMEAKTRNLRIQQNTILAQPDIKTNPDSQHETSLLLNYISDLKRQRNDCNHKISSAQYRIMGETVSCYWSSVAHKLKPCNIIYSLECLNNPHQKTHSDHMAELARDYHDKVQTDSEELSFASLTLATCTATQAVDHRLSNDTSELLSDLLTYQDIASALNSLWQSTRP